MDVPLGLMFIPAPLCSISFSFSKIKTLILFFKRAKARVNPLIPAPIIIIGLFFINIPDFN